jgi:hypothetical protein
MANPSAPGKRRRLTLGAPFQLGDFSAQPLDGGSQLGNLTLLLGHQRQQVFSTQRGNVFRQSHGVKYRPLERRLQARTANQLPKSDSKNR